MAQSKPMWRDPQLEWTEEEYEALRTRISQRAPLKDESQVYRVLLCGAVGAGKSSFVNTILSAIRNEVMQISRNARDDKSVTKKFRAYRFRENIQDRPIRVTMCDTMGFEHYYANGPPVRDMDYILSGHIKDGYVFDPKRTIDFTSEFFNQTTQAKDKVHVLVIVIDVTSITHLSWNIIGKLREITKLANDKDIRWMVALTKVDSLSKNIASDLRTMFSDKNLENLVKDASDKFEVNISHIFPMQNYGPEIHCTVPINILALHTLEHILRLADNTLGGQQLEVPRAKATPIQEQTPELLPEAWRSEANLSNKVVDEMLGKLANVKASHVPKFRLVLMGPCGGGKSAFINSAMSVFYKRITAVADTDCTGQLSTTSYNEYVLEQGREGAELDILLADTMGVLTFGGLKQEDIPTILEGKVACNTEFNPATPLPCTSAQTSLAQQHHVLVLVLNGAEIESYSDAVLQKIKSIIKATKAPGRKVLRAVLVTHLDKVCQHVAEDTTKVFRSQAVQQCLESVKQKLGVPMPDILPVVNFADDTEIAWQKSALILLALQQLVEKVQDHMARIAKLEKEEKEKREKIEKEKRDKIQKENREKIEKEQNEEKRRQEVEKREEWCVVL